MRVFAMIGKPIIGSTKQSSDCNLCKGYRVCSTAMSILADIATVDIPKGEPSSTLVRVGHFSHGGIRITARILGPMRVDGGLLLLTQTAKGECPSHRVYFLNDVYNDLSFELGNTEYASDLDELIGKAMMKRDRMLKGTTNYFSGGKVVKIL
jgi:hypothetical protein